MRGVADKEKRKATFEFHRFNADILILQETHSSQESEQLWRHEWGGQIYFSHGTTSARGIAVCIRKGAPLSVSNVKSLEDGRTIILDVEENNQKIVLVAIYAPNEDSPQYFRTIREIIKQRDEKKVIVGDFNLTLDVEKDRLNTYHNNGKARDEVCDMMEELFLREIWRIHHEEEQQYSWYKRGNIQKASRIDFALVSAGLDQYVELICYLPGFKSDHRALYIVLNMCEEERGSGYWKFNTTFLQNLDFVRLMNNEIEQTLKSSLGKDAVNRWEILKTRIKKVSSGYAKSKKSEDKLIIGQLAEIIQEYESRMPLSQEDLVTLENTKLELEEKNV